MVLILATAAIIIMKRDIRSLIKTYAFQSLLVAVMALLFYAETGIITLLLLAVVFIVSKVWIIPHFMGKVQRKLENQARRRIPFPLTNHRLNLQPIHITLRLPRIHPID